MTARCGLCSFCVLVGHIPSMEGRSRDRPMPTYPPLKDEKHDPFNGGAVT